MPLNNQLIKIVENLNKYELEQLESKVEELLGKSLSEQQIIKLIEESKFYRGEECPRCKSAWIIKNGKIKGRQKFKCKLYGKQFDEFTNSPLSNTNLSLKIWSKFCKLMFNLSDLENTYFKKIHFYILYCLTFKLYKRA